MAPARMMQFIDKHVKECATCQQDPDIPGEVEKIRDFILPEARTVKPLKPIQGTVSPDHRPSPAETDPDEGDDELEEVQDIDEELDDEDVGEELEDSDDEEG